MACANASRVLAVVFAICPLTFTNGQTVDQEIFAKAIDQDLRLVVRRVEIDANDLLKATIESGQRALVTGTYTVSAAILDAKNVREIPLATLLEIDRGPADSGCHVLAFARDANDLVLAVAIGHNVALWRVSAAPYNSTGLAWLPGWQANPLIVAQDQSTVHVTLSRLKDARWSAVVTDLRVAKGAKTVYEQAENNWCFTVVRSWRDNTPSQPTIP